VTDPGETANLVDQLTRGYREHVADEARTAAVPGRVIGSDVEGQADTMADAAARLAELLAAFGQEPRRALDAITVFRGLSRSAESMAAAAAELRRQEWFDLDDEAAPGGLGSMDLRDLSHHLTREATELLGVRTPS
jgi:hypothetical protein